MKLPDGVTIHTGGRKYKGEIPETVIPKAVKKKLEDNQKPAAATTKGK